MLVVGSHGHGVLADALLGSISNYVVHHSTVPVLVVPRPRDVAPRCAGRAGRAGLVEDPAMPGLLAGMRVLDLSVWRPMPHATQILADLGAEVLKLEPPGGDPMRGYPEIFASVARGKRSVEIDLRTADGLARALDLAAAADVVCEAWRPGVADRLGVGYDAVRARRADTIYCSLSGYGAAGPLRDVPGHDVNFQALAGALAPRDGVGDGAPTPGRRPRGRDGVRAARVRGLGAPTHDRGGGAHRRRDDRRRGVVGRYHERRRAHRRGRSHRGFARLRRVPHP